MTATETRTIADFIEARIAEDEAAADRVEFRPYVGEGAPVRLESRVLAQCAALRAVVAMFAGHSHEGPTLAAPGLEICKTLASIWADNPGYRDEWRP